MPFYVDPNGTASDRQLSQNRGLRVSGPNVQMSSPGTAVAVRPNGFTMPPNNPGASYSTALTVPTAPTPAPVPAAAPTRMSVGQALRNFGSAARQSFSGPAARAGGAAGGAAAGVGEAVRTGNVLANPNATALDVGTQAAEGLGRFGSAGIGAATGAKAGMMFGPAGAVIGGLGGGAAGYFAGDSAIKGLRSAFGVDPRSPDEQLSAAPPAQPVEPVEPDQPIAPTTVPGRGQGQVSADESSNQIMRSGNSFSGDDIKTGFTYGGDGAPTGLTPAQGGGGLQGGGTVTSLNTSEGMRQNQMELRRLVAERQEREAGFAVNQPGGGLSGFGSGTIFTGARENANSQTLAPSTATGGGSRAERAERMQAQSLASAERIATMREGGDDRRANLRESGETGRANMRESGESGRAGMREGGANARFDVEQETTRRGQDSARTTAQAQARLKMAQDLRDFKFSQQKFGAERGDAAQSQRGTREKEFAQRVDRMFTDSDGNVDGPRAAEFQAGIDRSVARLTAENPKIKSIADLGPAAEQKLVAATTLLQRVREQGSMFNPFQIDKIKSIDPLDLVDLQVDPKTGNRIVTRGKSIQEGGSRGFVIPARFFETEEANFFMPGTPTNRFDMLQGQGAR